MINSAAEAIIDKVADESTESAPEILCAEALSEIQEQLDLLEDAKRAFAAWMLRFLTFNPSMKRIETATHVIRLATMSVGCEACEQKKRDATQFWHPGATSAFPYVAVEKKRGVA